MNATGLRAAAASVLALWLAACAGSIDDLPVRFDDRCVACDHPACDDPLEVQYLGSGGFALRRGGDEILTGPFFSNPSLLRTGLGTIETDEAAVEEHMPDAHDASAVLVGHAHYDHLMDVPAVVRLKAPDAVVYASRSGLNSIASEKLAGVPVDPHAWTPERALDWMYPDGTDVRVLAIESMHAPHLLGITFMQGSYDKPQKKLPKRGSCWLEGRTHAFLIEFLDAPEKPGFSIHYQDSASDSGVGFPPPKTWPGDARPYKILLPTVASHAQVDGYPDGLLSHFEPDFTVLGHWEDFFRPFTRDPGKLRAVPATDVGDFLHELEDEVQDRYVLPAPLTRVRFARSCP